MEYIHDELGKKFIFGLKANRLVALSEEARKKVSRKILIHWTLRMERRGNFG
jgi:hypothetical protein